MKQIPSLEMRYDPTKKNDFIIFPPSSSTKSRKSKTPKKIARKRSSPTRKRKSGINSFLKGYF